jgi:hypothetical protein
MQKIFTILYFILVCSLFSLPSVAQTINESDIWSVLKPDPSTLNNYEPGYRWTPSDPVTRYLNLDNREITIPPNFRPKPGSNTTQSEMSVDVHPLDNNFIFASANATNWPFSTIYGTGVYYSFDGGENWTGYDNPPFGTNKGIRSP